MLQAHKLTNVLQLSIACVSWLRLVAGRSRWEHLNVQH
jgi:hypothetical protein